MANKAVSALMKCTFYVAVEGRTQLNKKDTLIYQQYLFICGVAVFLLKSNQIVQIKENTVFLYRIIMGWME